MEDQHDHYTLETGEPLHRVAESGFVSDERENGILLTERSLAKFLASGRLLASAMLEIFMLL